MARRESQGLQITLIIFVMLTIILAVTTIAFWNRSKTLAESNAALEKQNAEALNAERAATDQAMRMKVWLGQTPDTTIDAVEAQYNRDMSTYGRSAPEVQRNYKDVPALLFAALQTRNKDVADLRQQQKDAQAEFDQTRQQLVNERDEAKRIQAESEAELRKTRDEFTQNREQLNQEKEKLSAEVQQLRTELADMQTKSAQQVQELQQELHNKDLIISQRDSQIKEVTNESFEVPDGKVLWVNPRTGMASINLGAADGLRRQVTFSVFGVDVNNLAREEKKGSLEVTRVVDDHLSEARITDDTLENPILAGDVIYTPLWNAKSALHFALAGSIDIDGDGQDDRELVKQLIRVNNGTIDAEEKNGEVKGAITRHTRYLVRGDEPEVGESEDADAKSRQDAWTAMIKQADQLGVEQMSVEKLLDMIGYDGEKRTLPLGERARPEDFAPSSGAQPGQGSVFRERQPRSTTNRGS
jgi:hypothetical protein